MKLPSLDDLNLDDDLDEFIEEPNRKKKPPKKSKKSKHEKSEKTQDEVPKRESGKPKIPKTEYDAEGNPILSIPDLDDVDLTKELDRFFD